MSYVADVILLTFNEESGISEVQKWLKDNEYPQLVEISGHAGGNKGMQSEIWAAAINYFFIDEFAEALKNIQWKHPQFVQLLVKNEDDVKFMLRYGSKIQRKNR